MAIEIVGVLKFVVELVDLDIIVEIVGGIGLVQDMENIVVAQDRDGQAYTHRQFHANFVAKVGFGLVVMHFLSKAQGWSNSIVGIVGKIKD